MTPTQDAIEAVLVRETWSDWNPIRNRALAWEQDNRELAALLDAGGQGPTHLVAEVHVRPAMDRRLWGTRRLQHELDHARDPSFTNETHHRWYCFCVRVGHPFRLRDAHSITRRAEAEQFRDAGRITVDAAR